MLAFEHAVPRAEWDRMPSRVDASVDRLLDLLARHGATGTFFTVGWLGRAEAGPGAPDRRAGARDRVAQLVAPAVTSLTPDELREDVRRCRTALEQAAGRPVSGFRAPSFSIVPGAEWAFDVLIEEGYRYDSSMFPIRRPGLRLSRRPGRSVRDPPAGGTLLELPMATTTIAGVRLAGRRRRVPPAAPLPARSSARSTSTPRAARPGCSTSTRGRSTRSSRGCRVSLLTRMRHYGGLARTCHGSSGCSPASGSRRWSGGTRPQ